MAGKYLVIRENLDNENYTEVGIIDLFMKSKINENYPGDSVIGIVGKYIESGKSFTDYNGCRCWVDLTFMDKDVDEDTAVKPNYKICDFNNFLTMARCKACVVKPEKLDETLMKLSCKNCVQLQEYYKLQNL